jgi:hypothetical protein
MESSRRGRMWHQGTVVFDNHPVCPYGLAAKGEAPRQRGLVAGPARRVAAEER